MISITATELVRNMSSAIEEVRITGRSLSITKGSRVIATLSPPPRKGLSGDELVQFMASLPGLANDSETYLDDINEARDNATMPDNPWE